MVYILKKHFTFAMVAFVLSSHVNVNKVAMRDAFTMQYSVYVSGLSGSFQASPFYFNDLASFA